MIRYFIIISPSSFSRGTMTGSKNTDANKRKRVKEEQENRDGPSKQRTEKHQYSHGLNEEKKTSETGKRIAGLIFMCDPNTRQDCFEFRVMGMSGKFKQNVMNIQPGLKLFLFDTHIKMMYGVYQASSAGGMKLVPKAFNGRFPAQVRFNIHDEFIPIPEDKFKKAIIDNYDEKTGEFRRELTLHQVKRLTVIFRDATREHKQTAPPAQSQSPGQLLLAEKEYRSSLLLATSPPHVFDNKEPILVNRVYPNEEDYRTYGLRGPPQNLVSIGSKHPSGPKRNLGVAISSEHKHQAVCDPYDNSTASLVNRYLPIAPAAPSNSMCYPMCYPRSLHVERPCTHNSKFESRDLLRRPHAEGSYFSNQQHWHR